jgi:peptide alpha-N-acetyltransferase
MLEHRASLLARLGRAADAEAQYRALLATNPDHYRWHYGLQIAMGLRPAASTATPNANGASAPTPAPAAASASLSAANLATLSATLTDAQRSGLTQLYAQLAADYPRSSACRRIPLDFLRGAAFEAAADAYVRRYLLRGIPSLFMDLRPLYE